MNDGSREDEEKQLAKQFESVFRDNTAAKSPPSSDQKERISDTMKTAESKLDDIFQDSKATPEGNRDVDPLTGTPQKEMHQFDDTFRNDSKCTESNSSRRPSLSDGRPSLGREQDHIEEIPRQYESTFPDNDGAISPSFSGQRSTYSRRPSLSNRRPSLSNRRPSLDGEQEHEEKELNRQYESTFPDNTSDITPVSFSGQRSTYSRRPSLSNRRPSLGKEQEHEEEELNRQYESTFPDNTGAISPLSFSGQRSTYSRRPSLSNRRPSLSNRRPSLGREQEHEEEELNRQYGSTFPDNTSEMSPLSFSGQRPTYSRRPSLSNGRPSLSNRRPSLGREQEHEDRQYESTFPDNTSDITPVSFSGQYSRRPSLSNRRPSLSNRRPSLGREQEHEEEQLHRQYGSTFPDNNTGAMPPPFPGRRSRRPSLSNRRPSLSNRMPSLGREQEHEEEQLPRQYESTFPDNTSEISPLSFSGQTSTYSRRPSLSDRRPSLSNRRPSLGGEQEDEEEQRAKQYASIFRDKTSAISPTSSRRPSLSNRRPSLGREQEMKFDDIFYKDDNAGRSRRPSLSNRRPSLGRDEEMKFDEIFYKDDNVGRSRRPSLSNRRPSLGREQETKFDEIFCSDENAGRRPSLSNRRPSLSNRRPSLSNRRPSLGGGEPPEAQIEKENKFDEIFYDDDDANIEVLSPRFTADVVNVKKETNFDDIFEVTDENAATQTDKSTQKLRWARVRERCGIVVNHPKVQNIMVVLIVINAAMMGIGTYDFIYANQEIDDIFELVDILFLLIFTIEIGMQWIYYGYDLFLNGWLVMDLCIVMSSWFFTSLQVLRGFKSFRVFRALRVIRALRLVTRIKSLQSLVAALVRVIPRMSAILALTCLIFYIFAVMFTMLFKRMYALGQIDIDYFGRLDKTLYTLFQMMTLDWAEVARSVMEYYKWAWLPFVAFICMSSFIVFNLIIGVICDAVSFLHRDEKLKELDPEVQMKIKKLATELIFLKKNHDKLHNTLKTLKEILKKTQSVKIDYNDDDKRRSMAKRKSKRNIMQLQSFGSKRNLMS